MLIMPERLETPIFGEMANATEPDPLICVEEGSEIQLGVWATLQTHPAGATIFTFTELDPAPSVRVEGVEVKVHGTAGGMSIAIA